jgi:hypothetical protein
VCAFYPAAHCFDGFACQSCPGCFDLEIFPGFFLPQRSSSPPCTWILHCFTGSLCRNHGIAT